MDVFYTGCMNMPVPLTPAVVSPVRRGHKKETTCGFLLLVNLPLSLGESGANRRPATAAKLGYGSRVTVAWLSPPFRSSQTAYCYTGRKVYAGATYPCRAIRERVMIDRAYEDKLYQTPNS